MAENGVEKRGIIWTGLEKVLLQGIGFIQGVALARLLDPRDFGLAAMLGIFLGIGAILSESGLGAALIAFASHSGGLPELESRARRWNMCVSAAVLGVIAAISPLIARFYAEPSLSLLAIAMGVGMMVNAWSVADNARLNIVRRFGTLSAINVAAALVAFACGVATALAGFGVWSIPVLSLAGTLFRAIALRFVVRRSPLPPPARSPQGAVPDFRRILGYGWKMAASGILGTLYWHTYSLVAGKMFSPAAAGLFARATRWSQLPGEVVNGSIGRVSFVEMARGREAGGGDAAPQKTSLRFLAINSLLLWPLLIALWVWAEKVVVLVLGEQWFECVPLLRLLLIGAVFKPVANIAANVLKAGGRADLVLRADSIRVPVSLAFIALGVIFGGLKGLCIAKVAADILEAAAYAAFALASERKRKEDDSLGPVDFVYCWCNSSDPDFIALKAKWGGVAKSDDKCRFSDNGELRYSLLSVQRYAPWARRIWIVVNDTSAIPPWLAGFPKTTIVRHSEIIPAEYLPLFNPLAIEFFLHRIPGLAERFVYSNDDMFIMRPVSKDFFFDRRGRIICRYGVSSLRWIASQEKGFFAKNLLNNRRLAGCEKDDYIVHHCMDGYTKSAFEEVWRRFPAEIAASCSHRFRDPTQLEREIVYLIAMQTGRGVFRLARRSPAVFLLGRPWWESLSYCIDCPWCYKVLRLRRPYLYCLNDTEGATDEDRAKVLAFLEEEYPGEGEGLS